MLCENGAKHGHIRRLPGRDAVYIIPEHVNGLTRMRIASTYTPGGAQMLNIVNVTTQPLSRMIGSYFYAADCFSVGERENI